MRKLFRLMLFLPIMAGLKNSKTLFRLQATDFTPTMNVALKGRLINNTKSNWPNLQSFNDKTHWQFTSSIGYAVNVIICQWKSLISYICLANMTMLMTETVWQCWIYTIHYWSRSFSSESWRFRSEWRCWKWQIKKKRKLKPEPATMNKKMR